VENNLNMNRYVGQFAIGKDSFIHVIASQHHISKLFIVVHESGVDESTGVSELLTSSGLYDKYKIEISESLYF
jgi:hypothetical protein